MRALHRAVGTVVVSTLAVLALAGCDPVDAPELAASSGGTPPSTSRSTTTSTTPPTTTPPTTTPPTTTSTTPTDAPPSTGAADPTTTRPGTTLPQAGSTTARPSATTAPPDAPPSSSVSTTPAPTPTSRPAPRPAPPAADGVAGQVLDLVNTERSRAGCDPVRLDDRLTAAALRHSRDMAENDFVEHTGSDGSTFGQRIRAAGHPSPRSENIAAGRRSAAEVMAQWMSSSGHRRNILDCSVADMGVARAESDGRFGVYWTQTFGRD